MITASQNGTSSFSAHTDALLIAIRRSRHIRGSRPAFVYREMRKSTCIGTYSLRGSRARISLRHDRIDAFLLDEVIRDRVYEMPSAIEAVVGEPQKIVDLGANIGLATISYLTRYPNARVVAFEPDPDNFLMLQRLIAENGLERRVDGIAACAATAAGRLRFSADASPLSRVSDEGNIARDSVDVFPTLADADLVKMDIEGGEWAILADSRLAQAGPRAIVLEYHDWGCLSERGPRDEAQRLLERAGFRVMEHHDQMLWAWR